MCNENKRRRRREEIQADQVFIRANEVFVFEDNRRRDHDDVRGAEDRRHRRDHDDVRGTEDRCRCHCRRGFWF